MMNNEKDYLIAVHKQMDQDRKNNPNFPDHIMGAIGRMQEPLAEMVILGMENKYRNVSYKEPIEVQMERLAIKMIASGFRFLNELNKKKNDANSQANTLS